MGVGTDDAVAGGDNALLGQQRMLDAHLAHVIKMADAMAAGKFTALLALFCGLDVLVGNEVVQNDGDAVLIKNGVKSGFFKFVDSNRGGNVVAQNDIQLCTDQLAGNHGGEACVGSQDFLSHSHSHDAISFTSESCCCRR